MSDREGKATAVGMGCSAFYEISVLAAVEPAMEIVDELFATQQKMKTTKQLKGLSLQTKGLSLPRLDQSKTLYEADSDGKTCAVPRLKRREDMFSSN